MRDTEKKYFDNEDSLVNKRVSLHIFLNVFWISFEVLWETDLKYSGDEESLVNKWVSWRALLNVFWFSFEVFEGNCGEIL